jgi:hypothetical protein
MGISSYGVCEIGFRTACVCHELEAIKDHERIFKPAVCGGLANFEGCDFVVCVPENGHFGDDVLVGAFVDMGVTCLSYYWNR